MSKIYMTGIALFVLYGQFSISVQCEPKMSGCDDNKNTGDDENGVVLSASRRNTLTSQHDVSSTPQQVKKSTLGLPKVSQKIIVSNPQKQHQQQQQQVLLNKNTGIPKKQISSSLPPKSPLPLKQQQQQTNNKPGNKLLSQTHSTKIQIQTKISPPRPLPPHQEKDINQKNNGWPEQNKNPKVLIPLKGDQRIENVNQCTCETMSSYGKGRRCFPSFLLIGAQKSGTSTLSTLMSEHPQILHPNKKELLYFFEDKSSFKDATLSIKSKQQNRRLNLKESLPSMNNQNIEEKVGVKEEDKEDEKVCQKSKQEFEKDYLSQFPLISKLQFEQHSYITGEWSATYLPCLCCSNLISTLLPKIKIIILLRHPIERSLSRYKEQEYFLNKNHLISTIEDGFAFSSFDIFVNHSLYQMASSLIASTSSISISKQQQPQQQHQQQAPLVISKAVTLKRRMKMLKSKTKLTNDINSDIISKNQPITNKNNDKKNKCRSIQSNQYHLNIMDLKCDYSLTAGYSVLGYSKYGPQLVSWLKNFNHQKKNLLLIYTEDLSENSLSVMRSVEKYLGIGEYLDYKHLSSTYNARNKYGWHEETSTSTESLTNTPIPMVKKNEKKGLQRRRRNLMSNEKKTFSKEMTDETWDKLIEFYRPTISTMLEMVNECQIPMIPDHWVNDWSVKNPMSYFCHTTHPSTSSGSIQMHSAKQQFQQNELSQLPSSSSSSSSSTTSEEHVSESNSPNTSPTSSPTGLRSIVRLIILVVLCGVLCYQSYQPE